METLNISNWNLSRRGWKRTMQAYVELNAGVIELCVCKCLYIVCCRNSMSVHDNIKHLLDHQSIEDSGWWNVVSEIPPLESCSFQGRVPVWLEKSFPNVSRLGNPTNHSCCVFWYCSSRCFFLRRCIITLATLILPWGQWMKRAPPWKVVQVIIPQLLGKVHCGLIEAIYKEAIIQN